VHSHRQALRLLLAALVALAVLGMLLVYRVKVPVCMGKVPACTGKVPAYLGAWLVCRGTWWGVTSL
jgi:hypothetical protein